MHDHSLEKDLYSGRFDDGLLDLCVGVGLLGVGASWLWGHPVYGAVLPALLVPLWIALRQRVTEPRLGRVRFSPERREAERSWLAALLAAGTGTLALAVAVFVWRRSGGDLAAAAAPLVPLIPGLLIAGGFVAVSLMIGARRFAIYAVSLLALAASISRSGGEPGLYLAAGGALLCLWAAGLVARFLARHPALDGD